MRETAARHLMLLIIGVAGTLTLVLLATTPGRSAGAQAQRAAETARAPRTPGAGRSSPASSTRLAARANPQARSCSIATNPEGYVNPLGRATVKPKRIDQGVDYKGSGELTALGPATITKVATGTSVWHGDYVEYRLLTGREAGCYVYYAEGVTPAPGLHVGQTVQAGQLVATIVPDTSTGIEIGWAVGHGMITYAAAAGQWSAAHEQDDIPSAAGLYFSALIASLGAPAGQVEG